MTPSQEAIRRAKRQWYRPEAKEMYGGNTIVIQELVWLDPEFWKKLGEAEGWIGEVNMSFEGLCQDEEGNTNNEIEEAWRIPLWQYYWHRCINEYLTEGGTVDNFFKDMLNSSTPTSSQSKE